MVTREPTELLDSASALRPPADPDRSSARTDRILGLILWAGLAAIVILVG